MKIYCPDCGNLIPASDMDLQTGLAKCQRCNSVFDFEKCRHSVLGEPQPGVELIPHPPEIVMHDYGKDWQLRWRWFGATYIGMALFCVAWDSFLIFWYSIATRSAHVPWIMVVFPVGHVAVGIGMTYATLAGFLNSTSIRRDGYELSIRDRPVPWPGNRQLAITDIAQLYCEIGTTNQWNQNRRNNYKSYALSAVLRDGQRVRLLSGQSVEYVKFLENEIERRLGLQDRPVAGELQGA